MQVHLYVRIDHDLPTPHDPRYGTKTPNLRLGRTVILPTLPQVDASFVLRGDPFGLQFTVETVVFVETLRATPEEELENLLDTGLIEGGKQQVVSPGCYFEVLCLLKRINLADPKTWRGVVEGLKAQGWEEVPDAVPGV